MLADSGTLSTEAGAAALVEGGVSTNTHTRLPPAPFTKAVHSVFSRSKCGHFETASNGLICPSPCPNRWLTTESPTLATGGACADGHALSPPFLKTVF